MCDSFTTGTEPFDKSFSEVKGLRKRWAGGGWKHVQDSSVEDAPSQGSCRNNPSVVPSPGGAVLQDAGQVCKLEILDPEQNESVWKRQAIADQCQHSRMNLQRLPWEEGEGKLLFSAAGASRADIPGLETVLDLGPTKRGLSEVLNSTVVQGRLCEPPIAKQSQRGLSKVKQMRFEQPDEDIRRLALNRLRGMIMHDPPATTLGSSLVNLAGEDCDRRVISQSFHDCFRAKATSTLQKRAGSLVKFFWWAKSNGVMPLRFSEADLYAYLCHLRSSKAGASALQHTLEALAFLDGTAEFVHVDLNRTISGRCKGAARDSFLTKEPLKQKDPLLLVQVRALEELCMTASARDVCILGQLLFCVHACCRWKDSQRIRSLSRDSSRDVTLVFAEALKSKTTLTADSQSRFLPYVALGTGVTFADWSDVWLQARESEGLSFGAFALPSYSERECAWIEAPMSSSEATVWLREFLEIAGTLPEGLSRVGSHSCKSTVLTWAGRSTHIKFSPNERRLLGHHMSPGDKSMLTYSREAYTSLYGKVLALFRSIESGAFEPDRTAVARVLACADAICQGDLEGQGPDRADQPDADSDSDTSQASSAKVLVHAEQVPLDRVPLPKARDREWVPDQCVIHKISGVAHIVRCEKFLKCGRLLSRSFDAVPVDFPEPRELDHCAQCSRSLV